MQARPGWCRQLRSEHGSGVTQAAAIALLAAALIGAMLGLAPSLGSAVERSLTCLVATLTGGGTVCETGAAVAEDTTSPNAPPGQAPNNASGQPQAPAAQQPAVRCPSLPNAGVYNHDQPQDTADLYRNINDLYQTGNQTMDQQKGPIGITEIGDNRYLVTLVGIEWQNWGEKFNYLPNAAKDQLNLESQYQAHVRDIIRAQIPPGAEIVFAAHSHGGIVSQNLARDETIQSEYNVTHVVTYGAPVSGPPRDGVDYTMYEVAGDFVPGFGVVHLPSFIRLYGRGDYHIIPPDKFYWNPKEYHSVYAQSLEALRNKPGNEQLLALPFPIERWGPTRTYQANAAAAAQLQRSCR